MKQSPPSVAVIMFQTPRRFYRLDVDRATFNNLLAKGAETTVELIGTELYRRKTLTSKQRFVSAGIVGQLIDTFEL
jgi:hypothetical protein